MTRIYAIGDLHLSLSGEKPMDVFGEHWCDHHLLLEKRWRSTVGHEDTILVPGDISWAMDLEGAAADLQWLDRLPGLKLIVKGNHDYWWSSLSKLREALPPSIVPLQHSARTVGNAVVAGVRGWITPGSDDFHEGTDGKVFRRELLRLEMALDAADEFRGRESATVVMMHYPPVLSGRETEFSRIMSDRGVDLCVYGHIHMAPGTWPEEVDTELDGVVYRLVSADRLDFTPMELEV